jgi:hypothetical protein
MCIEHDVKDFLHEARMSFRERSAWITLLTTFVCFGVYFGSVFLGVVSVHGFGMLHLLLLCVLALAVLQVSLTAIAARLAPKEAKALRDEREALIQARSHTVGYYVLVAAVLAIFIPGHLATNKVDLMNFALLDVVVAALAVSLTQVILFRRGA